MNDTFYEWYKTQDADKTFEHLGVREIAFISFEAGRNSIPMKLPVKPEIAEIENLKRALRVIYTWAKYDNGALLRPDDVVKLLDKYKKQFSV